MVPPSSIPVQSFSGPGQSIPLAGGQHCCPGLPQGSHVPLLQRKPNPQELFAQQGSPPPPHFPPSVGGAAHVGLVRPTHVPMLHRRPAQQGCPSPPHVTH